MTAFSGKALAPQLAVGNPDRALACQQVTSLFANLGNSKRAFNAIQQVLPPLLVLLEHDVAAAAPLASLVPWAIGAGAYPEAETSIDAIEDRKFTKALGWLEEPWSYTSTAKMTWARQRALLAVWRGECRLAAGDRVGGEEAMRESARRAAESNVPTPLGLTGARSPFQGSWEDQCSFGRTMAAHALSRRHDGLDPCPYRKAPKAKKGKAAPPDTTLEHARALLDDVLASVRPRAVKLFAPLVPQKQGEHAALTREHKNAQWLRIVFFESARVYEQKGNMRNAKRDLAHATWIAALFDPALRWWTEHREACERLHVAAARPV